MTVDRIREAARELVGPDAAAASRAVAVLDAASWSDLLEAVSPAVHPYIEHVVESIGALERVPAGAQETLARARRTAVAADLQRRAILRRALTHLAGAGVDCVLLKGAALAQYAYPAPHLRPMRDVDIWVGEARLGNAVQCLLANGFEVSASSVPDGEVSPTLHQHLLFDTASRVRIELHGLVNSLACLTPVRIDGMWARAAPAADSQWQGRVLHPEDALVHACLHMAMTNRFAYSQLPLLDVTRLVEHLGDGFDWDRFARTCAADGIAAYVAASLRLAARVWGARVSARYLESLGNVSSLAELEALAIEQVWEQRVEIPWTLERALREPRGAGRARVVLRRALTEPFHRSPSDTSGPLRRAGQIARRLFNDVTVKIPRYVQAWTRGDLAGDERRRRIRLAERRGQIGALAAAAERQIAERSGG